AGCWPGASSGAALAIAVPPATLLGSRGVIREMSATAAGSRSGSRRKKRPNAAVLIAVPLPACPSGAPQVVQSRVLRKFVAARVQAPPGPMTESCLQRRAIARATWAGGLKIPSVDDGFNRGER